MITLIVQRSSNWKPPTKLRAEEVEKKEKKGLSLLDKWLLYKGYWNQCRLTKEEPILSVELVLLLFCILVSSPSYVQIPQRNACLTFQSNGIGHYTLSSSKKKKWTEHLGSLSPSQCRVVTCRIVVYNLVSMRPYTVRHPPELYHPLALIIYAKIWRLSIRPSNLNNER